jgi:hypothetical protein
MSQGSKVRLTWFGLREGELRERMEKNKTAPLFQSIIPSDHDHFRI